MKAQVLDLLDVSITQAEFAALVGISEARVSQMLSEGLLPRDATGLAMLRAYVERLRDQAAGRMGETGGLDLVQERALLAREQRIGQRIKNEVALKTWAPIGLLTDVLAMASQSVVDRLDALRGQIRRVCPDLPAEAHQTLEDGLAKARNDWMRATQSLVVQGLEEGLDDADEVGDEGVEDGS